MVLEALKEVDALLEGHFLLSSGNHSDKYCQCAKLFEHPEKSQAVVKILAEKLEHLKADLVVGPAMGGVIAAYELSAQLGLRNIFTERVDNIMTIKRGFEIKSGQKVIIMEDVITTGRSSMEVADIVNKSGGEVLALACIVDRSAITLPYPVYSAVKLDIQAFEKQDCPLCKQGIPFVKPGSRKF